jgi:hypothetical protein
LLGFVEDSTPVNYLYVESGDANVAPKLGVAGDDTNIDLHLQGKATGNVRVSDGTDNTKAVEFEVSGATTGKTCTITSSHTDDRAVTLPDATTTLIGHDNTVTVTNKTMNADVNTLTNVNADELDPVNPSAAGVYGIPFIIAVEVANTATTSVYTNNAPFKFRVLDCWTVSTVGGNDSTCTVDDGANVIVTAFAVGVGDKDIARAAEIDDAEHEVASAGSLRVLADADDDFICYISCMRVD